ncbi:P-loop containing nucleoside triphosphate hydrolase protein [Aspergillus pseudodeflectus]|uniref:P-loop containing nucleoside triphosphate hydrolase protein n=1 Tax=Aspergillus pseudodeflectus TaxID=176178 RepID=A0ABR4KTV3_9EURO
MEAEYARLAKVIRDLASAHHRRRYLVAIAGVPGSGKTTTAEAILRYITAGPLAMNATLVPMDGFHLPRTTLDQLPNREEAYIRRGAPWTFDVARFVAFIRRLRTWADAELSTSSQVLHAPGFCHETKDPVEDVHIVTDETSIVILEGNYLLLDEPEWRDISQLVDYRVFVETDLQEARARLAKRHVQSGIENSLEEAFRRVDRNDYLNSIAILQKLITPDLVVRTVIGLRSVEQL